MSADSDRCPSMAINVGRWRSMSVDGDRCRSMEIVCNQPQFMAIDRNRSRLVAHHLAEDDEEAKHRRDLDHAEGVEHLLGSDAEELRGWVREGDREGHVRRRRGGLWRRSHEFREDEEGKGGRGGEGWMRRVREDQAEEGLPARA